MAKRDGTRLRWWLWRRLIKRPSVCPATAHSRIIGRYRDQSIKVDDVCLSDVKRNGNCWCGKLRDESHRIKTSGATSDGA